MFDPSLYDVDYNRQRHEAGIKSGGYLYRLATLSHCGPEDVLSGKGSLNARDEGRFHVAQQQVSYCSNNVLITFAEVLFHIYNLVLKRLGEKQPSKIVYETVISKRCLTIFRVEAIRELVFIDSEGTQVDFDPRVRGATVVYPEPTYSVFRELNQKIRVARKKGIVYPSARHSKDFCFALFDDETANVQKGSFRAIPVQLQLIAEDQGFSFPIRRCDPFSEKLHSTMGYYEILDPEGFEKARLDRVLNPPNLPSFGLIDFVRRRYKEYPKEAAVGTAPPDLESAAQGVG